MFPLSSLSQTSQRHVDHGSPHEIEQLILSESESSEDLPFHRFRERPFTRNLGQLARRIHWPVRRIMTLRRVLLLLVAALILFVSLVMRGGIPPTFDDIRDYERHLPQHNVTEALFDASLQPQGRRKYLRLEGGAWGVGLNNVLQQVFHLSFLAHKSGRVYVFEDYTWSHLPFRYTLYDYALRPTTLPLNAIISGASAGGITSPDGANTFRSVSLEFFDSVCPKQERVVIDCAEAPTESEVSQGTELIDWWLERLRSVEDEPCVVIHSTKHHMVFDFMYFGSKLPLSVLPSLTSSPILSYFSWSPIVLSAVARNFALLQPSDPRKILDGGSSSTLKGLIAVHLRRGDFKHHCLFLHKHRAHYVSINQYPPLPDKFTPPSKPDSDSTLKSYVQHCIPEIDHIQKRLHQIRTVNPSLNRVYLLSNGSKSWLSTLTKKLKEDGWTDVAKTNDLQLDSQQTQVSGAVDMAIAGKAEVFVGNGFSSLTANIVMLRLAKGLKPDSNRFL